MVNRGITPPDTNTDIGVFRVRAGDTNWSDLEPVEPGYGDYTYFSDTDIEQHLAISGSIYWAIYEAYLALATGAAIESSAISDYDLKVDTTKRADQLFKIAEAWRSRAADDDLSAGEDAFEIVNTGTSCGGVIPEASTPIYGRKYTGGRIC